MPIALLRIDERLIHGQVVVGWGARLRPERYVVVDDDIAEADWEQELYRLGLPDGAEAEFLTVGAARARLDELDADPRVAVLLTKTPAAMRDLGAGGRLRGREVNLGGLHHAPGRTERLPYVHIDPADEEALTELAAEGARVTAQDLPGSKPRSLSRLLG